MRIQAGFLLLLVSFIFGCGGDFRAKQGLATNPSGDLNGNDTGADDGPVVVGQISVTQVIANGIDQAVITINLINDKNDPVRGVTPRLFEDGTFNIVSPCSESNAAGESVCRITSTKAGTRPIHTTLPTEFQTNITFVAGPPAKINIMAGDDQTALAGGNVLIVPKVQVMDAYDNPVSQIALDFVPSSGGSVGKSKATTNAVGEAGPGSWTLSTQAGNNTLTVSVGALSVVFKAMGIATNPLQIVYLPGGQCATGKLEVYVNNSPHPKYQYVDSDDCIEIEDSVARGDLKIRCVDLTGAMLPSDFVGPAVDRRPKSTSICKVIHRA